ncbi:phosphoethanolamine--lipid A transferase [Psychromonas arctica]|uniref:Phosphoethanolamine--lipid A transferase n=1 Tax=Psychromonas arctica TaxID=168275 RepID=A0ABU9H8N2_9GAMM
MNISHLKSLTFLHQRSLNVNTMVLLLATYFAVLFNQPIIQKVYALSSYDLPLYFISHLLLLAAFVIIFSLLAWPYVFKIIFIPLVLSSALAFYASNKYNVMFDYTMIENIFETNSNESVSYINISSVSWFIVLGLLPALLLLKIKITYNGSLLKMLFMKAVLLCSSMLVILIIAVFYYKDYASIGRNNAYLNKMINPAHVYNTYKYIKKNYFNKAMPYSLLGQDATITSAKNSKPTLMVFVVGETARSQNIAYNGYQRNTNPYTENMGLISFKHVQTCGTATAVSLPCLFSNMNRPDYNKQKANNQDNVLDILSHAGVDVRWIDNDGGDKQVAKNLDKIDINKNDNSDLCNKHSCYDQVLLRQLPRLIAKQPGKDKLLALHLIGSHGPTYYQRYPQDKTLFKPACERSDIENCSDQEIVNVYDNSIAYTDYVLAETITLLKQYQEEYNVALFYLSDHGESLGENGLYLHGTPYVVAPDQQTHVPWFMWANEAYFTNKSLNKACLEQKAANDFVSHDNLFHTLLGFYGVETKQKNKDLDITYSCKA